MYVLIGIALKSLLIAGVTLGVLQLMKRRSAAERSAIAHLGLLALIIMALAPLVLPSYDIAAPALFGSPPAVETTAIAPPPATDVAVALPTAQAPVVKAAPASTISSAAAAAALYAVPAAILLFVTFLALARLIALRARAEVLVDGHWLSALARAQRRMGFKHGTALLTSNDLASPISWGLMRPVILLSNRAVEASGDAEAIIAHELAHVARMDWAKLLLARLATALFWFNPLVWMLAREAHQLREETADDAVLAADIADTDYAQLLVGVARHECPGLLLGAHGVAPSKSSLARRVARVLDGKTVRGPVARSFAAGVFVGAVAVAAPLAALTLTPAQPQPVKSATAARSGSAGLVDTSKPYYAPSEVPTDLPHIIAQGVTTAVTAVSPDDAEEARQDALEAAADVRSAAIERAQDAAEEAREAAAEGRQASVVRASAHRELALRSMGITPEYAAAIRATAPQFSRLQPADMAGMQAVGVTPQYARELIGSGFPRMSVDEMVGARAVGLTGAYVTALRSAGVRGDLDDFIQLRAMGVSPALVARARKAGYRDLRAEDLVQMQALGQVEPPAPPRAPRTGRPAPPPGGWGDHPPAGDPDDD